MNYYYDLNLNFSHNHPYKFYEWELEDNLINIKKTPLIRVDEKILLDFLKYDGFVEESFLNKVKSKTTYKINGKIKRISYAAIFTDTKSSIALIFDNKGLIVGRSLLMLEDELSIIELGYSIKKEKISFHKVKELKIRNTLRQEEKMKKIIKKEIDISFQNNDKNKLIYYHLEWFNKYSEDIKEIYNDMINELAKPTIMNIEKIYDLILLSTS